MDEKIRLVYTEDVQGRFILPNGAYAQFWAWNEEITLDGSFHLTDLEFIVAEMRRVHQAHNRNHAYVAKDWERIDRVFPPIPMASDTP